MRKLTPSLIIAVVAAFFAFTGGAFAAKKYVITSIGQIKPSVVRELRGRDGQAGATGAQGEAGRDGRDGATGQTGAQGKAGRDGTPGPQGADGSQGPAGRDGIGATIQGTLPNTNMGATAWDDDPETKTIGTVGPFTVKLECRTRSYPGPGGTDWQTWATMVAQAPDMPTGYLLGASFDTGYPQENVGGLAFETVDMPGVGKLGVVANVDATQSTCSASNIKTYLTS